MKISAYLERYPTISGVLQTEDHEHFVVEVYRAGNLAFRVKGTVGEVQRKARAHGQLTHMVVEKLFRIHGHKYLEEKYGTRL